MFKDIQNEKNQQNTSRENQISNPVLSPRLLGNCKLIPPKNSLKISGKDQNHSSVQTPIVYQYQSKKMKKNHKLDSQPELKLLPYLIKELIHQNCLHKVFQTIKSNITIHNFSLVLVQNKCFRHLNDAFLAVKSHDINLKAQSLSKKISELKNSTILYSTLSRSFKKIIRFAFQKIKTNCKRKSHLFKFIQKLDHFRQEFIEKKFKRTFLSQLKFYQNFLNLRQKCLNKLVVVSRKICIRQFRCFFLKIEKFTIFKDYQKALEQKKKFNTDMISLSSSRRSMINQERQKLRKLKLQFDILNLDKNRSLNELNRQKTNLKSNMNIDIKQIQQEESQIKLTLQKNQYELNNKTQQLEKKQKIRQQAKKQTYLTKVTTLHRQVINHQNQEIKISQLNALQRIIDCGELQKFEEKSPSYYFHQNIKLQELIRVYEKAKKLNWDQMDSEYLNRCDQNMQLRKTLGLLAGRQIEKNYSQLKGNFENQSLQGQLFLGVDTKADRFSEDMNCNKQALNDKKLVKVLPVTSKRTSNANDLTRITGKITSRATYYND